MKKLLAVLACVLMIATVAAASDVADLIMPDEWGSAVFVLGSERAGDLKMTVASKRVIRWGTMDGFGSLLNPLKPERGIGLDFGEHDGDLRGGLGYLDKQHWGLYLRTRW